MMVTCSFMWDSEGGNFTRQFELVSTHGIFVAPHGAALMNILYMPPLSAVVELFPNHLDHTLYTAMSILTGIANYPVHGIDGHIAWSLDKVSSTPTARVLCVLAAAVCRRCCRVVTPHPVSTCGVADAGVLRERLRPLDGYGDQHRQQPVSVTRGELPLHCGPTGL